MDPLGQPSNQDLLHENVHRWPHADEANVRDRLPAACPLGSRDMYLKANEQF